MHLWPLSLLGMITLVEVVGVYMYVAFWVKYTPEFMSLRILGCFKMERLQVRSYGAMDQTLAFKLPLPHLQPCENPKKKTR